MRTRSAMVLIVVGIVMLVAVGAWGGRAVVADNETRTNCGTVAHPDMSAAAAIDDTAGQIGGLYVSSTRTACESAIAEVHGEHLTALWLGVFAWVVVAAGIVMGVMQRRSSGER